MSYITQIKAFEVNIPMPEPLELGAISVTHREYSIVRIEDIDGYVGTAFGLSRNAPIAQTILKTIAPLWKDQLLSTHQSFYNYAIKANEPLGTNGIFWRALSLCDCALYDLLARRENVPLYRYLGGESKTIPTVLVGGYPLAGETPDSLHKQMNALTSYQPAGVKIGSSGNYEKDTARLRACRDTLPEAIPLMIDMYWQVSDAQALLQEAHKWTELNMGWIEDPVAFDDFEAMCLLSDNLDYPVAMGDEQSGIRHFKRIIKQGNIDIIRLDATVCGGVRAFITICKMAEEHNVPVSSHIFHHLHSNLATALPNVRWIETFPYDSNLDPIHKLWKDDLDWLEGSLVVSERPGIGISWDEDKLMDFELSFLE